MTALTIADQQTEKNLSKMPEELLGERVRTVRESLNLTHDGLSNLSKLVDKEGRGISRTTIRGYELGTYKPGAREVRILSLALKKSPSWLIMGTTEGDSDGGDAIASENLVPGFRWGSIAFQLIALMQLSKDERGQITSLIETMLRLKIGEVRFRSSKAFVEEFADIVQDAVKDRAQHNDINPISMRRVLLETAETMKQKHGAEEANLLLVVIDIIFAHWENGHK